MKKIFKILSNIVNSPKFTFLTSHRNLGEGELSALRALVGKCDLQVVRQFETDYAGLVGSGSCVAFASARMGFYAIMKVLGISRDDEVILLGATCSVMVNAVLKAGAKPIFADIDPDTFGSSLHSIKQCVSKKTKLIVAQHSFGIPCDIKPIIKFAQQKNIFVVEDCALTLGSAINGKIVGNFGDVAIFSTDHSKPLSSLSGGIVYSKDEKITVGIRKIQNESLDLDLGRQKAMWRRLLIKHRLAKWPTACMQLIDYFDLFCEKFFGIERPFLVSDYSSKPGHTNYPYPARLPAFLAQLGIFEIERWPQIKAQRAKSQELILSLLGETNVKSFLPASYYNNNLDIVPLRFCWSMPEGELMRRKLSKLIDTGNTWFMRPIIACEANLETYGYRWSTCPNSEELGPNMINLPCDLDQQSIKKVIKLLA